MSISRGIFEPLCQFGCIMIILEDGVPAIMMIPALWVEGNDLAVCC